MKNLIFCCVLLSTTVSVLSANIQESDSTEQLVEQTPRALTQQEILVIASNQVFVDIMNTYLNHAYQTLSADQSFTRKPSKNTASILLYGLAQTCAHIGNIFCAPSKQEKQQNMLNVAGTVLNVAAQLSERHSKPKPQITAQPEVTQEVAATENETVPVFEEFTELDKEELTTRLALLASFLIVQPDNDNQDATKAIELSENLEILRWIPTQEKRREYIASILASSTLARQFLGELFTKLHSYIHEKGSLFYGLVKEHVKHYLTTQAVVSATATPAATEQNQNEQNQPAPEQQVKAISEEEYRIAADKIPQDVLDYLTVQFIHILQHQLKLSTSSDAQATTHEMLNALHASVAEVYCS